ncbi:glycosyltransferase family 2 protein [Elongatibacter sediminis]|uniref:Glycosyltransferase n=1 Tax=Elongatibacter sediminis TaxID=3119006 RepID=A0AAW9RHW8_9GAMM
MPNRRGETPGRGRERPIPWPVVVVPVFNAPEALDACLASLYGTLPSGARVLLVDDASDDRRVAGVLDRWLERAGSLWNLERQPRNRGFVATANRGMQAVTGDVVLLNSDTVVTAGWLEGLTRCLESDPGIATATPWTNNGEIASLPRFCAVNPIPSDPDSVARIVAATGDAVYPDLPTAVGFCMAVRRAALDAVGYFDPDFGLGYGEENDFSMRVRAAGWRNVLCDDVYVVHVGGQSFGPLGLAPDPVAMQRVLDRHPDYLDRVKAFIEDDPLAERRTTVVRALEQAGVLTREALGV